MKHVALSALATGAAIAAFAMPAQAAVTVDSTKCSNLSIVGNSCLFNGVNLANAAQADDVENAYNPLAWPDISLDNLLGTNNADGSGFGSAFAEADRKDGTWSTNGYVIDYLAVSGGNFTMLYYLGGASSGDWTTLGIINKGGQQPGLSHLAFFGREAPPVPEPASWALMIAGLGTVGFAMRRRKMAVSFA